MARRRRHSTAALVLGCLVLACCGDDDAPTESGGDESTAADPMEPEPTATEPTVNGPGSGTAPASDDLPEGVVWAPLDATLETIADGFGIPWAIEVLGDGEYLVSERLGALVHIVDGTRTELAGIPSSQTIVADPLIIGGINDVSLHPGFDVNGWVYLAYVDDDYRMVVGRFDFADRTVRDFEVIFESNAFSIGSRIAWEDDNTFLVTQGAAGSPYPDPGPQDLASDSGKIHRLRADGSVPDDNPIFDGATEPTSIWSYGHRDHQGLLVDADGTVYANEHGPLGGDELNIIERGGNYGWPRFSFGLNYDGSVVGDLTLDEAAGSTVLPLQAWGPEFNMAPSGLTRLDGSSFPAWDGALVWGALAQRRLIAFDQESATTSILLDEVGRVRDVAQLPDGDLVILLDAVPDDGISGRVVRVSPG